MRGPYQTPGVRTQKCEIKYKKPMTGIRSRVLRRGGIKSLATSCADRVAVPHAFPQNSENFFTCVQCGLGNRAGESATNFAGPSCRQIATRGATGARERQSLAIKISL